jgi:hypothetical protein
MENILRCIAREANRSGDAKTLFHALDLLEHLIPIATGRIDAFMTFCAELETEGDGWKARRAVLTDLKGEKPPLPPRASAHDRGVGVRTLLAAKGATKRILFSEPQRQRRLLPKTSKLRR